MGCRYLNACPSFTHNMTTARPTILLPIALAYSRHVKPYVALTTTINNVYMMLVLTVGMANAIVIAAHREHRHQDYADLARETLRGIHDRHQLRV